MEKIKSLVLRVTERCNLRCAYCYAAGSGCRAADMSEALAIQAVSLSCSEGESLRIQFTGGEPLLRLETMEAVFAYGRRTGRRLRLAVQTNGTLLTPDVCRRLAAMDCALGVSLDGVGAANGSRVFPDGSPAFDAAVQGVRNWGKLGRRCNLTVVVTRANASRLGQLPDLALWLGNVTGVGLDLFRPLGRGAGEDLSPGEEDLTAGLRALARRTEQLHAAGIPFRFRELERLKRRRASGDCGGPYCYAQTAASLAVDPDGNCWPCSSLVGLEGCLLGNLRDGLPGGPRTIHGLPAPERCRRCDDFALCRGGCPAGRMGRSGENDPLICAMHRVLREETGGEP